ncbi:GDSL-type esterase/lipase family protein [Streptomyces brasiliscabiei]|uniref:GDSL-type esterase/lipase family protein n=1 Tax=Streptomyces brasiliscabiei TaxID=2736302 RepID=A0ABU8G9V2_9ACTN
MKGTSMYEGHAADHGVGSAESTPLFDPPFPDPPWQRFVVLGDVTAKSPGATRGKSGCVPWTDRVAETLRSVRPDLAYLNLGRRGHSATQVRTKQLARALAFRGDLAAVVAGGHEALGDPFDVDATEAELHRIVGPLRDSGADVITLGVGPRLTEPTAEEYRGGLQQRLRLLAARTRELALQHGALHVDMMGDGDVRRTGASDDAVAAAVIRRLRMHLDATKVAA